MARNLISSNRNPRVLRIPRSFLFLVLWHPTFGNDFVKVAGAANLSSPLSAADTRLAMDGGEIQDNQLAGYGDPEPIPESLGTRPEGYNLDSMWKNWKISNNGITTGRENRDGKTQVRSRSSGVKGPGKFLVSGTGGRGDTDTWRITQPEFIIVTIFMAVPTSMTMRAFHQACHSTRIKAIWSHGKLEPNQATQDTRLEGGGGHTGRDISPPQGTPSRTQTPDPPQSGPRPKKPLLVTLADLWLTDGPGSPHCQADPLPCGSGSSSLCFLEDEQGKGWG
ncbi:hypothetical protein Z043_100331, partial [Scleropages formosus]